MGMDDIENRFIIYQRAATLAAQYRHALTKLADSFDLTGAQLNALCMFEPNKPQPMKYLCPLLTCDASNITNIIDKLESHQLIAREDNPSDRRVKMIRLTQKGAHLRQLAIASLEDIQLGSIDSLTANEKRQLALLLLKSTDCFGEDR